MENDERVAFPLIMQMATVKNYEKNSQNQPEYVNVRFRPIEFYRSKGIICTNHFLPISKQFESET